MLTVKKFGAMFNLSIGGYVAGIVGILLALLTIIVFPPDMDLQGKFSLENHLNNETWTFSSSNFLDDDPEGNVTKIMASTIATVLESTTDDDVNDDDAPISEPERKDEINDSKQKCCEKFLKETKKTSSSTT